MLFDYRKEYQRYSQYYLKNLKIFYSQPLAQNTLYLIFSLITILFFSLSALRPTILTIGNLIKEINLKKDIDNKLNVKLQQLEAGKKILEETSKYADYLDNSLPFNSNFNRIEREIEWLSFKNNLSLNQISFSKFDLFEDSKDTKKTSSDIHPINFSLNLAGSYKDLKNFLEQLENLDRIVLIDSLKFTRQTETEGAQLQLNLQAKVFFFPKIFNN